MSEWSELWSVIDGYFVFLWNFKVWGIPIFPVIVGITVVGIITRVFLITARSDDE